jgi:hypothetical protein
MIVPRGHIILLESTGLPGGSRAVGIELLSAALLALGFGAGTLSFVAQPLRLGFLVGRRPVFALRSGLEIVGPCARTIRYPSLLISLLPSLRGGPGLCLAAQAVPASLPQEHPTDDNDHNRCHDQTDHNGIHFHPPRIGDVCRVLVQGVVADEILTQWEAPEVTTLLRRS